MCEKEAGVDMALEKTARYLRNNPNLPGQHFTFLILLSIACGKCFYFLIVFLGFLVVFCKGTTTTLLQRGCLANYSHAYT